MREIIVTETMRCDLCGSTGTEVEPIVTKNYTWDGQEREVDLCVLDLKEVSAAFEAVMEKSRRPENPGRAKKTTSKRQPYSGDTRFNQWYNKETGLFECPGVVGEGADAHKCQRQFTMPNGLAVHHKRMHGKNL